MKKNPLLILGAGGHAKIVADLARLCGKQVVGFIDDVNSQRRGEKFSDSTILGGMDDVPQIDQTHGPLEVIVAIGDCKARVRLAASIEQAGLKLATLLHPMAILASDVSIGRGTIIVGGAVLNAGSSVGANVIINTVASIDHECRIGDGVHIGPAAALGGNVSVGDETWVGIGAIIKDGISIGRSCVIGAGALVLKDVPDNTVTYGSPAKEVRKNL